VFDQNERRRILAEARDNIERLKDGRKDRRPWRWGNSPPPEEEPPPAWPTAADEPITQVPLVSCAPMDAYLAEAEAREAEREAEKIAADVLRKERERRVARAAAQQYNEAVADAIGTALDDEMEKLDRVIGDALVNVGDKILEQVDRKIAALRTEQRAYIDEQIGQLRAENNVARAIDKGSVLPLPSKPGLRRTA
jgi:hypothetical protein